MLLESQKNTLPDNLFLQPPPGQLYVRSFLFSRKIDARFARLHLLARVMFVLSLSSVLLRTIDTSRPDLVGATLLLVPALLLFLSSGMQKNVARLYLLLTLSPLLSLFITWALFNPVPGSIILLQFPVYSGQVAVGFAFWQLVWLAVVGLYYFLTRKLVSGILLATLAAFLFAHLLPYPEWTFLHLTFFHPLRVFVSDRGILIAGTKVIGYAGMIFATIALVVTSRDTELIGVLRQLHVPQTIIFFLSTVFRSLNLALADYNTIRQAQFSRAVSARPRSLFRRLSDLASLAVPLIATMIRRSSEIGDALLLRGYTLGKASADFYETSPWRIPDWAVVAVSLVFLLLAFVPHDTLTHVLRWL